MAHEIETINGTSLAVFSREPAWHRLGQVLQEPMDVTAAMAAAHLGGWNIRKAPLTALTDEGVIEVPGKVATVRTNPITRAPEALGVVSDRYGIVQNEEAFSFAQNILDASDVTVEAAGSLQDGKRVWMLLHLPETIMIGGTDEVRPYLLVTTAHDGTGSVVVQATYIRVVCANTLAAALGVDTAPVYRLRHSSGISGKVSDARTALALGFRATKQFELTAERWAAEKVTAKDFQAIVERIFPLAPAPSKGALTRTMNRRESFASVYGNANQESIRGTAYGVVNAAVEWADFYAKDDAIKGATSSVTTWGDEFRASVRAAIVERVPALV